MFAGLVRQAVFSSPAAVVSAGSGTQWSAANSSTHWAISGTGNTIGTLSGTNWALLMANNAKSTGKFIITIPTFVNVVQAGLGTSSTAKDITQPANDTNTVIYEAWTGRVSLGGTLVATWSPPVWNDGDTITVDITSGLTSLAFYRNTTQLLGTIDASSLGSSLYPIAGSASSGQVLTADFTNF